MHEAWSEPWPAPPECFRYKSERFFQIVPRVLLNESFDQEARLLLVVDVRVQQEPCAMLCVPRDAIAIHNAEIVRVQDALRVRLRLQRDAFILFVIQDFLSKKKRPNITDLS